MAKTGNPTDYSKLAKQTQPVGTTIPTVDQAPGASATGSNPEPQFHDQFVSQTIDQKPQTNLTGPAGSTSGARANSIVNKPDTISVDKEGSQQLGNPKVYDSVGEAGSGFTNLSHLLALNKDSAWASANDLAKRTKAAGQSAQGAIGSAGDEFNQAALSGSGVLSDPSAFDPAAGDAQSRIDARKGMKYTGPNDLTSMGSYADLAKKVGSAQDMAKNVSGNGYGLAAQVNKETGLSPVQSAASAFYMGVNNPNLQRAGNPFTNLQKSLDEANSRAMNTASMARGWTGQLNQQAGDWQKQLDDYNASGARTDARGRANVAQANSDANADQRNKAAGNGTRPGGSEIQSVSDINWAIGKGEPAEIAYGGVSYDDWVAEGKPSWEDYKKKHPEADRGKY